MIRQRPDPAATEVVEQLHPLLAGVVFSHLVNGDDVSIVDGHVAIEYGPNQHNADGPAVDLSRVDPDAILSARFNGEPVDETVLAALARRALDLGTSGGQ
jgi:hypothetical protein